MLVNSAPVLMILGTQTKVHTRGKTVTARSHGNAWWCGVNVFMIRLSQ